MASWNNIRGALLEEIVLFLLQQSGYRTVDRAGIDLSLHDGHSGLEVIGRGEHHQIDAVADFIVSPPFSHRQRLLVEAKCYRADRPVSIDVIRNAIGVLKDVSEFHPGMQSPRGRRTRHQGFHCDDLRCLSCASNNRERHPRYHYQYAVFSTSGYTVNAQRYAFAQDVFLVPLAQTPAFQQVVNALFSLDAIPRVQRANGDLAIDVGVLRQFFRYRLTGNARHDNLGQAETEYEKIVGIERVIEEAHGVGMGLMGMISGQFPVLLLPQGEIRPERLRGTIPVSIHYDESNWYIRARNGSFSFAFDLPKQLFELYATSGRLDPVQALSMKEYEMSQIQAIVVRDNEASSVTFELDPTWLNEARETIRRSRE